MHIHPYIALKKKKGPQFRHPWGITPKISNDLPGILLTPHAKFYAKQ